MDSRGEAIEELTKQSKNDIISLIASNCSNDLTDAVLNTEYLSLAEGYAYIANIVKGEEDYFTKAAKSYRADKLSGDDDFYEDYKDVEAKVSAKIDEFSLEIATRIVSKIKD